MQARGGKCAGAGDLLQAGWDFLDSPPPSGSDPAQARSTFAHEGRAILASADSSVLKAPGASHEASGVSDLALAASKDGALGLAAGAPADALSRTSVTSFPGEYTAPPPARVASSAGDRDALDGKDSSSGRSSGLLRRPSGSELVEKDGNAPTPAQLAAASSEMLPQPAASLSRLSRSGDRCARATGERAWRAAALVLAIIAFCLVCGLLCEALSARTDRAAGAATGAADAATDHAFLLQRLELEQRSELTRAAQAHAHELARIAVRGLRSIDFARADFATQWQGGHSPSRFLPPRRAARAFFLALAPTACGGSSAATDCRAARDSEYQSLAFRELRLHCFDVGLEE